MSSELIVGVLGGANFDIDMLAEYGSWEGRTREKHNSSELTGYYHHGISRPASGIVYKNLKIYTPYTAESYDQVFSDRTLQYYWQMKAANMILPINPCVSTTVERFFQPISYHAENLNRGQLTVFEGDDLLRPTEDSLIPPASVDQGLIEAKLNEMLVKARAKCDSSSVQVLVTLGELKETISMVRSAAVHLVKFVDAAKIYADRLVKLKSARKITAQMYKDVESAWMQARFGWRPFYHEVGNLINAVGGLRKFYDRHRMRAGELLPGIEYSDEQPFTTQYYEGVGRRSTTITAHVSAGILCTQRYAGVPDTYGITKVPYTIWELTPCSWLIDYYANVGKLLQAATPDTLFEPRVSWLTVRTVVNQQITCENFRMKEPTYTGWATGGYFKKQTTTYERFDAEGVPSRLSIALANPGLSKTMDTVAVARQKFASLLGWISKATNRK